MKHAGWVLAIGIATLATLFPSLPADAGELKIGPEQFRLNILPLHGGTNTLYAHQAPDRVSVYPLGGSNVKDTWYAWAPVNLPAGTVITSILYYHGGSTAGKKAVCQLARVKMGESGESVGYVETTSDPPVTLPLVVENPSKLTIDGNYRYYINLVAGSSTTIFGVKILY